MFFAHNVEAIKSIGSQAGNIAVNDAITPFMILLADG